MIDEVIEEMVRGLTEMVRNPDLEPFERGCYRRTRLMLERARDGLPFTNDDLEVVRSMATDPRVFAEKPDDPEGLEQHAQIVGLVARNCDPREPTNLRAVLLGRAERYRALARIQRGEVTTRETFCDLVEGLLLTSARDADGKPPAPEHRRRHAQKVAALYEKTCPDMTWEARCQRYITALDELCRNSSG